MFRSGTRIHESLKLADSWSATRLLDIEKAQVSHRRGRPDFILHIGHLADIENRNVVPGLHKLYSLASWVVNDLIYQHWGDSIAVLWEVLGIFSFLASLLLWISAVRTAAAPQPNAAPLSVPPQKYGELSRELDSRLQLLNKRLTHLLRSEDSRP